MTSQSTQEYVDRGAFLRVRRRIWVYLDLTSFSVFVLVCLALAFTGAWWLLGAIGVLLVLTVFTARRLAFWRQETNRWLSTPYDGL
jgi:hypothetical protein